MQTKANRLIDTDAVDERTLKPVVKLLMAVGALLLLWALVSNLPGADAIVPETAVTYGAVLGAAVTIGIVAVLTFVALRLEPLVVQTLAGPGEVVADAASMAKYIVLFLAVVTAHGGLAPLIVPSLEAVDLAWTYDMLFLALALIPTAIIAIRMYGNLDPVATLVTKRVSTSEDDDQHDDAETASTH